MLEGISPAYQKIKAVLPADAAERFEYDMERAAAEDRLEAFLSEWCRDLGLDCEQKD